jgi:hypothetical protein
MCFQTGPYSKQCIQQKRNFFWKSFILQTIYSSVNMWLRNERRTYGICLQFEIMFATAGGFNLDSVNYVGYSWRNHWSTGCHPRDGRGGIVHWLLLITSDRVECIHSHIGMSTLGPGSAPDGSNNSCDARSHTKCSLVPSVTVRLQRRCLTASEMRI